MAIDITIEYGVSEDANPLHGYALTVTATASTGMPKEIFIFQQAAGLYPPDDQFVCIADPVDLEEVPVEPQEGAPDPIEAAEMPYYRRDTVTLIFRSTITRDETKRLIAEDINTLVRSLQVMSEVVRTEEVVYRGDNDPING